MDGYDELYSQKKQNINRQIENFIDLYSDNNFIITTRPGSGAERFPRFFDFKICELDVSDVNVFVNIVVGNNERKNRILRVIQDSKNFNYSAYLSNPLLLSMFILAFESHPEIPNSKSAFYRNVFDTLYSKHDGITKNSFPRERLTNLQREDFENILNLFSYLTLCQGKYSYTTEYLHSKLDFIRNRLDYSYNIDNLIYDFHTPISILTLDGFEYKFPHRTMQEHFAAQFISKLPTAKKDKAYQNIVKSFKNESFDFSFHFWGLCKEVDNNALTKYFLIPELKSLAKQLDETNDYTLLNSFIKIFDVSVIAQFSYVDLNKDLTIAFSTNHNNSLIDFTNIIYLPQIIKFANQPNIRSELRTLINKRLDSLFSSEDIRKGFTFLSFNKEMKEVLIKNNVKKIITEFKDEILTELKNLEDEIERQGNILDDLLDL